MTTGAKRKYYDKKQAEGVANRMARLHKEVFVVYVCRECGAYHVGRNEHYNKKEEQRNG
jgi:hypothetical protein